MHGFMLVALLFVIYHRTQTNNFAGKVGKVILHLHNRQRSYVFYGKEMQSVVEREKNLTNANQTLFQKVSILKYLYMHRKPSFRFKVTGK